MRLALSLEFPVESVPVIVTEVIGDDEDWKVDRNLFVPDVSRSCVTDDGGGGANSEQKPACQTVELKGN